MKKEEILRRIFEEYKKIKADERYNLKQKNIRYGELMTLLEQHCDVPILAGKEFDQLDNDVKELYLMLSNARNFEVYE